VAYNYKNCYTTTDLWTGKSLNIAIKKDDSEIENYDKNKESEGKDECSNRLELRSKRMRNTTLEYQFLVKWFERLDKAKECFEEVQKKSNDNLERLFKEDLAKSKKNRTFLTLNAFLLQNRDAIYTRKQMIDLMKRIGDTNNPVRKADKFKEHHKIEYFSKKDLNSIIRTLKKKMIEYFSS
jgi:hypothetical protein